MSDQVEENNRAVKNKWKSSSLKQQELALDDYAELMTYKTDHGKCSNRIRKLVFHGQANKTLKHWTYWPLL